MASRSRRKPIRTATASGGAAHQGSRRGRPGTVAEPKEGQKVTLKLENKGSEQMAVVLKVNGMNTIFQETQDPLNCTKWVLEPGKTYNIRGFYTGETGDNLLPFKVLSDEESKAKAEEMKDNTAFGCVEIFVFRSGTGTGTTPEDEEKTISRHVSFRGTKREITKGHSAPRNVKEAQDPVRHEVPDPAQRRQAPARPRGREAAPRSSPAAAIGTVEGSTEKGGDLKRTDFANPSEVYSLKIRYYTPGGASTNPGGTNPGGTNPGGTNPGGTNPGGTDPGTKPGQGQDTKPGQGQGTKPGQGQGQGTKPGQGQGNPPPK